MSESLSRLHQCFRSERDFKEEHRVTALPLRLLLQNNLSLKWTMHHSERERSHMFKSESPSRKIDGLLLNISKMYLLNILLSHPWWNTEGQFMAFILNTMLNTSFHHFLFPGTKGWHRTLIEHSGDRYTAQNMRWFISDNKLNPWHGFMGRVFTNQYELLEQFLHECSHTGSLKIKWLLKTKAYMIQEIPQRFSNYN